MGPLPKDVAGLSKVSLQFVDASKLHALHLRVFFSVVSPVFRVWVLGVCQKGRLESCCILCTSQLQEC